ncbi:unnamed protein product [Aphanomyces euteiches]|uniref:Glutathione peroxidase n=1 Tax=Aphanomyces euteiches TaxID=100861 RepID=A0A6G0XJ61_9STRA|nr:hypothetical protein Ae201684_004257 [Aphanomyces euteiches]KAH9094232.1 hypothetical protein Ae201684P_016844 [Aphanomyces euteiches]KAH9107932.1 hypothetical protein AeMF1_016753 [Aphanomyces euteiches]KAH9117126.1 hypothetical protein LEN26_012780 [Aphanomyces euteiches]KAH9140050.1 hypothetical protein AeRB84_015657 [Aphanomyces euteiches]
MRSLIVATLVALLALVVAETEKDIYHFMATKDNKDYPLANYDHTPVMLIVNVASECGFTDSNYRELQRLQDEYHVFGFEVLAFPCNQFGEQEPGTYDQIINFAQTKYNVNFNIFDKIDVNGPNSHPLYRWLKSSLDNKPVQWNFEKFIVVDGYPWKRYAYNVDFETLEEDILYALAHESEFHHPDNDPLEDHDEL